MKKINQFINTYWHISLIILLAVPVAAALLPVLSGRYVFFHEDTSFLTYPMFVFFQRSIGRKEFSELLPAFFLTIYYVVFALSTGFALASVWSHIKKRLKMKYKDDIDYELNRYL